MVKLAASAAFETAPPDCLSLSTSRLFLSSDESPVAKLLNKIPNSAVNTYNIDRLSNFLFVKRSEI